MCIYIYIYIICYISMNILFIFHDVPHYTHITIPKQLDGQKLIRLGFWAMETQQKQQKMTFFCGLSKINHEQMYILVL